MTSTGLKYRSWVLSRQQVTIWLFGLLFFLSMSANPILQHAGIAITGLDYIVWLIFTMLILTVNLLGNSLPLQVPRTYLLTFIALVLMIVLNFFFAGTQLLVYILGTFITLVFGISFMIYYMLPASGEMLIKIMKVVMYIILLGTVSIYADHLLTGESWRRAEGINKDNGIASALMNFNLIIPLILFVREKKTIYLWVIVFTLITLLVLLFFKSLITAAIILLLFTRYFISRKFRRIIFITLLLSGILVAVIGHEAILGKTRYYLELYVTNPDRENTPRNALYVAGFNMAADHFPFGRGQGTFGSYPVGKYYSPAYFEYNLDKLHGLSPGALTGADNNFLFDTFWSHILGENGFIGTLLYLILWWFPFYRCLPYLTKGKGLKQLSAFFVVAGTVIIFIQSLALSLPEQIQFILLYAGLSAIILKFIQSPETNKS